MVSHFQKLMALPEKGAKDARTADKGKGAAGNDRCPGDGRKKRRDVKPDAGRVSDGAGDLRTEKRVLAPDAGPDRDGTGPKDDGMAKRAQKTASKKPAGTEKGETLVRLIFPAPASLKDRIEAEWHKRKLKSLSATIRALLEEALA